MPPVKRTVVSVATEPTDTVDPEEYPVGSPEQTDATVAQLQELMAKQQAQIDKLMAERGIPADPVAAQIQALQDHVHAQANANPNHGEAYGPVLSYVDGLTSDALTTAKAAKAERLMTKLRNTVPAHELAYAHSLASDLHTMTLDPEDD